MICHVFVLNALQFFAYVACQGMRPCITCRNMMKGAEDELAEGMVNMAAPISQCQQNSREEIFEIVDHLAERQAAGLGATAFKNMQTHLGMHWEPEGLLYDMDLRPHLSPVLHYLRDPMHVLVSAGVANTEIALLIHEFKHVGIELSHVAEFSEQIVLPKAHGKPRAEWFGKNRLKPTTVTGFAGTVLSMVMIVECFLDVIVKPMGVCEHHADCFRLLVGIVAILSMDPEMVFARVEMLQHLIEAHREALVILYGHIQGSVKPKFHHLQHVPQNIRFLKKSLSCFTTERKHRETMSRALNAFRNVEHTVVHDMVSMQVQTFMDRESLFKEEFLRDPRDHIIRGIQFSTSTVACLRCGDVHRGDVVMLTTKDVGEVQRFWMHGDRIMVVLHHWRRVVGDDQCLWRRSAEQVDAFLMAHAVLSVCAWLDVGDGITRVLQPFVARYW